MTRFLKIIILLFTISLAPAYSYAQSASDLFSKGMSLKSNGKYQEAINSFKASMAINSKADNVKKCNQQIKQCEKLMRKRPSKDDYSSSSSSTQRNTLRVNTNELFFPGDKEQTIEVDVESQPAGVWTAVVDPKDKDWLHLAKSAAKEALEITCDPSSQTIPRDAIVTVSNGGYNQQIKVSQTGKKPTLKISQPIIDIGKKGGKEVISVECNSDTTYSTGRNFVIVDKPNWVLLNISGAKSVKEAAKLELQIEKLKKDDINYKSGRSGAILIRSQEVDAEIKIEQGVSGFFSRGLKKIGL